MSAITIRRAAAADIPWCVTTGHEFHEATVYGSVAEYVEADVRNWLERLLVSEHDGVIFLAEHEGKRVGAIGAIVNRPWFNSAARFAQELFWWVVPQARGTNAGAALLEALEGWWPSRARGLLMLRTPNIEPKLMDRLYRMKGFRPWDGYYLKAG